jgi:hypothetical protein
LRTPKQQALAILFNVGLLVVVCGADGRATHTVDVRRAPSWSRKGTVTLIYTPVPVRGTHCPLPRKQRSGQLRALFPPSLPSFTPVQHTAKREWVQGHYDLLLPRPGQGSGAAAAGCRSAIGDRRTAAESGSMRGGGDDKRAWKLKGGGLGFNKGLVVANARTLTYTSCCPNQRRRRHDVFQ